MVEKGRKEEAGRKRQEGYEIRRMRGGRIIGRSVDFSTELPTICDHWSCIYSFLSIKKKNLLSYYILGLRLRMR